MYRIYTLYVNITPNKITLYKLLNSKSKYSKDFTNIFWIWKVFKSASVQARSRAEAVT